MPTPPPNVIILFAHLFFVEKHRFHFYLKKKKNSIEVKRVGKQGVELYQSRLEGVKVEADAPPPQLLRDIYRCVYHTAQRAPKQDDTRQVLDECKNSRR